MKLNELVEALKLEHTIFALPFAYLGVWVAAQGRPDLAVIGWVTLAMVGARTAGMAVNRLIDLPFDRLNPRTRNWPVSAGRIKPSLLLAVAGIASTLFFYAAAQLNPLCLKLSPWAFLLLVGYPYTKRFTWACHFWLGLVLGVAPAAGWLAVTGAWDSNVLALSGAVLFWVAGFDILYALLDLDFDSKHSVYSIPKRFGLIPSLWISRLCHLIAAIGFGLFGLQTGRAGWFWAGWVVMLALLVYEHLLVQPNRLDRINKAFFTVNGWISVSLFLFTWVDLRRMSL